MVNKKKIALSMQKNRNQLNHEEQCTMTEKVARLDCKSVSETTLTEDHATK